MINNIIEIWYWTILLAALIGVSGYFAYSAVLEWRAAFRERREEGRTRKKIPREKIAEPYSRRLVIIHWLTLGMLIVAWYLGETLVDARTGSGATLVGYFSHALMGGAILMVTALRLTYRSVDGAPPPVGYSLMDALARGIHYGLYVLLILMAISGFMTLLTSTVGAALVTGEAIMLPSEYTGPSLIPHAVHDTLMTLLIAVVAVHILGVIKHQFILKDGLMRRMSLRRKGSRSAL